MDSRQQPCPYCIVNDLGNGFSMGCAGGIVIHFLRGMYFSPKSQRFYGGLMLMKKRAPILGGSFGMWAGVFSMSNCAITKLRGHEDAFNEIAAGAVTGGVLAFRTGGRVALKNAIFGGLILTAIKVAEAYMIRREKKLMQERQNLMMEEMNRQQRRQIARVRPGKTSHSTQTYLPQLASKSFHAASLVERIVALHSDSVDGGHSYFRLTVFSNIILSHKSFVDRWEAKGNVMEDDNGILMLESLHTGKTEKLEVVLQPLLVVDVESSKPKRMDCGRHSVLCFIKALISRAAQEEDNECLNIAFAYSYDYLTRKKIFWSVHSEKIAYAFMDLAFDSNKHGAIKEVLKNYRNLTQGQYSDSLKDVLQHYLEKKLGKILQDEIKETDIPLIRNMPDIETYEASSKIILASFNSEEKRRFEELRSKLSIVWEGYRSVTEIVRINQKLEEVYLRTLRLVFDFVETYNRKHEFKSFCRFLRSGLQSAFSKRERSEQQRAIYIDIQKPEVNTRNIQIRLLQYKVTLKLGLWQEAFQVLEDINSLMKIRRGVTPKSLKSQYYLNLAHVFANSRYWHYHTFAFYNYYVLYIKNPKVTQDIRTEMSNKMLLSALCIPPVTLESRQSKESQEKICSMLIASNKIPSKEELSDMIAASGIVEFASPQVKLIWNFMSMHFDVSSLAQGLQLLSGLAGEHYRPYNELLEDILIYRQLISLSNVYSHIKYSSLLRLVPLPQEKVKKILLESHQQRAFSFTFDEEQGVVVFQDKETGSNPYEKFKDSCLQVAAICEGLRTHDKPFVVKKAVDFIQEAERNFDRIRVARIKKFKENLKKPREELMRWERQKEEEERDRIDRERWEKEEMMEQAKQEAEEREREVVLKKMYIQDLLKIKEDVIVRIHGKKIEHLTPEDIEVITLKEIEDCLKETNRIRQTRKENKLRKMFTTVEYMERERRRIAADLVRAEVVDDQKMEADTTTAKDLAKKDFEDRVALSEKIKLSAQPILNVIADETQKIREDFRIKMSEYVRLLQVNYKRDIIAAARKKYEDTKRQLEEQKKTQQENKQQKPEGFSGPIVLGAKFGQSTAPPAFSLKLGSGDDRQQPAPINSNAFQPAPLNRPAGDIKLGGGRVETKVQVKPIGAQKAYVNVNEEIRKK